MRVDKLFPGVHSDKLEVSVESTSNLCNNVLRITGRDHTGRVNIVVEGAEYVKAFSVLKPETKLRLLDYTVSEDYSLVGKYFPPFVDAKDIAVHGTLLECFIPIHQENLPNIRFIYNQTVLDLSRENIDLSPLYTSQDPGQFPLKLFGLNNEKYTSLDYIKENFQGKEFLASCYATVLDCTSAYKTHNPADYQTTIKITDASIFPNHAVIVIFHKKRESTPKIRSLGDVIRLNDVRFKVYNGCINGVLPSNVKYPKVFLFRVDEDSLMPYALYNGNFYQSEEHYHRLVLMRSWAKQAFIERVPLCLQSTRTLSQASTQEENDVLVVVFSVCPMGVCRTDPLVLICYHQHLTAQLVVDAKRKKIFKYVEPGSTIRLRSVAFQQGRLYTTFYTDILVIPPFFSILSLPTFSSNEEELEMLASLYAPVNLKTGSQTNSQAKSYRLVEFSELLSLEPDQITRIEGFLVKISPENIQEISGLYCATCQAHTNTEICGCGTETDPFCELTLWVWDGASSEQNVVELSLPAAECSVFLNNIDWAVFTKQYLSPDVKFEVGVVGGSPLQVFGTKLIRI